MNLAWKKPYLASFGRAISGWIGLGVRITEGMPAMDKIPEWGFRLMI